MKLQFLARLLFWAFIVAMVWYWGQRFNQNEPSEKERAAMVDAARSYQQYKEQLQQGQESSETEVPQPRVRP